LLLDPIGQCSTIAINDRTRRGESGHPATSVRSRTFSSFSFSKCATALPLLPTC
jgi:hypothetical protein